MVVVVESATVVVVVEEVVVVVESATVVVVVEEVVSIVLDDVDEMALSTSSLTIALISSSLGPQQITVKRIKIVNFLTRLFYETRQFVQFVVFQ